MSCGLPQSVGRLRALPQWNYTLSKMDLTPSPRYRLKVPAFVSLVSTHFSLCSHIGWCYLKPVRHRTSLSDGLFDINRLPGGIRERMGTARTLVASIVVSRGTKTSGFCESTAACTFCDIDFERQPDSGRRPLWCRLGLAAAAT